MPIPTPILTALVLTGYKVLRDTILTDPAPTSSQRIFQDHDTVTKEVLRNLINEELKQCLREGADEDDESRSEDRIPEGIQGVSGEISPID